MNRLNLIEPRPCTIEDSSGSVAPGTPFTGLGSEQALGSPQESGSDVESNGIHIDTLSWLETMVRFASVGRPSVMAPDNESQEFRGVVCATGSGESRGFVHDGLPLRQGIDLILDQAQGRPQPSNFLNGNQKAMILPLIRPLIGFCSHAWAQFPRPKDFQKDLLVYLGLVDFIAVGCGTMGPRWKMVEAPVYHLLYRILEKVKGIWVRIFCPLSRYVSWYWLGW